MEEIKIIEKVYEEMIATFITLIPKVGCLDSFDAFRPIVVCNYFYNVIYKVLVGLNKFLSKCISLDKVFFLEWNHIHETIGSAEEGLHSIKVNHLPTYVIKIDLSKAYDRVC